MDSPNVNSDGKVRDGKQAATTAGASATPATRGTSGKASLDELKAKLAAKSKPTSSGNTPRVPQPMMTAPPPEAAAVEDHTTDASVTPRATKPVAAKQLQVDSSPKDHTDFTLVRLPLIVAQFFFAEMGSRIASVTSIAVVIMDALISENASPALRKTWRGEYLGLLTLVLLLATVSMAFKSWFPKRVQILIREWHIPIAFLTLVVVLVHSQRQLGGGLLVCILWILFAAVFFSGILLWLAMQLQPIAKKTSTDSVKMASARAIVRALKNHSTWNHVVLSFAMLTFAGWHALAPLSV